MKYRVSVVLLFFATIGQGYAQKLREKVGSNPTIIDVSAVLEVESTTEGFLPPRMTQAQMKGIITPPTGLLVYCTNCSPAGLHMYNGTVWVGLCSGGGMAANCGGDGFIGSYINDFALSSTTFSITLTNYSFATTTINFAASDLGLSGVAGLSVGAPTPSSVTLNSGQSQQVSYPITGTPTSAGTLTGIWSNLSLTCFDTQEVKPTPCGTYTTTVPPVFLEFQCHNLGANESANPFTPSWQLNGAYIQWGKRGPTASWQGAANDGASGFAAAPIGNTSSEANDGEVKNWTSSIASDGSWYVEQANPKKTGNDPCPAGYRVPTKNEWVSITNWSDVGTDWSSKVDNYTTGKMAGKYLYLPAAGSRNSLDGVLNNRGLLGLYWSSTEYGTYAHSLHFTKGGVIPDFVTGRIIGLSVRCVVE